MKKHFLISMSILLIFIYFGTGSDIIASDELKYSICKNNVVDAVVTSNEEYHAVNIHLTPSATKEFTELTGKNIGRRLEILFKDKIVMAPTIKAEITSGSIQLKAKSKKEAETLAKDILNYAPTNSCGVISQ